MNLRISMGKNEGPLGYATDHELFMFCSIPTWREPCKYFLGGVPTDDPFDPIARCTR